MIMMVRNSYCQLSHFYFTASTVSSIYDFYLQIIIDGQTGSGIAGDIAIDDLGITSGSCPQPGMILIILGGYVQVLFILLVMTTMSEKIFASDTCFDTAGK